MTAAPPLPAPASDTPPVRGTSRDLRELRSELREDRGAFEGEERHELARRWRLFAPMVLVMVVIGEVLPLLSTEFPPNLPLSASMFAVMTVVWVLALKNASLRTLSFATVAAGLWAGIYGGVTAADAGGFRSIHVLGMVGVSALLPGVFSVALPFALSSIGGSLVTFVLSCWLRLQQHGQSADGMGVTAFYCVFIAAFVVSSVERARRLRYRAFVSRRIADRLHLFAVEEVLCRHLPPSYVERVLSGEQPLNAAPERRTITVLFADIVGFTPLSERLPPEQLAQLMARFYEATGAAAFQRGATIDKFIGDAVMAMLGAPDAMDPNEQAARALDVAKSWHAAASAIQWEGVSLKLRIGMHQDVVAVGVFGGEQRSDYTVIGRGVNIAARLEQRCRPGEIVLSGEVMKRLPAIAEAVDLGRLELKGIPDPVHCFAVPVSPVR